MRRAAMLMMIFVVLLCGCGREDKTYEEGLNEGFKAGYAEALWESDYVIAEQNKIIVYADKYGYLCGYHDGMFGIKAKVEEYDTKMAHEVFGPAYEQGYSEAAKGFDALSQYGEN